MKAFNNGPGDDQCTAGWISLVDENGVELWANWVTPVPNEVWAELANAAGRGVNQVARAGYEAAISTLLDVAQRTGSPAAQWAAEYLATDPDRRAPAPS
jgi:hypothetical protein